MEVTIGKQPINGKMNVIVSLHDEIDGKGFDIGLSVWVDDSDSRAELSRRARNVAIGQLKHALLALENGGQ
ncbi:hypothetical protein [Xanthomonas campestris]|uniref:hypothetical protein n=1 Tax=Xanthomonas campestris TaxID=339 RepID=UPI00096E83DF|nr:hypothetical protein [Xanthomonas campestris]MCF8824633.1 hypothetical protein [Xanthomonas campestris pv. raphani]MEA9840078.1 hypothetical protein [Xanthomonas campestris pv. raphani]MEA9877659.1 hypothetical protein [Xanthomonas campestris pv. raphani]MEA9892172.1 hypothetical protein [Xanthomonas campestris pv. raphani]MEA9932926.1 hypothetical protein [Xanthomonas campestris pv. raphani]